MGKYTKILIGAILLSLANKILLGNLMFISFVEIGLIIYALYMITKERNRYYWRYTKTSNENFFGNMSYAYKV